MDNQLKQSSVLLKDEIERLITQEGMIKDYDPEYLESQTDELQPASYNMRVGSQYYYEGKVSPLSDSKPTLTIPPYDLVFVSSYETFELPTNVVARYDLQTSFLYQGLILQTGTQIDPGYKGKIFSLLFNLSDKPIELTYKQPFATMEFSYTTPQPDPPRFVYGGPRQNTVLLEQVLPGGRELKSGLGKLWESLQEFDSEAVRLHTRVDTMVGAVFQAMAFMIAALGIIVAAILIVIIPEFKVGVPTDMNRIITIGIGIAIFVVVTFGAFAWIRRTMRKISGDRKISKG